MNTYGGIAFNSEKDWSYGNQVKSEEDYLHRYKSITQAIKDTPYISGFCYTQITDVQQERNPKVDQSKIREINSK